MDAKIYLDYAHKIIEYTDYLDKVSEVLYPADLYYSPFNDIIDPACEMLARLVDLEGIELGDWTCAFMNVVFNKDELSDTKLLSLTDPEEAKVLIDRYCH